MIIFFNEGADGRPLYGTSLLLHHLTSRPTVVLMCKQKQRSSGYWIVTEAYGNQCPLIEAWSTHRAQMANSDVNILNVLQISHDYRPPDTLNLSKITLKNPATQSVNGECKSLRLRDTTFTCFHSRNLKKK